MSLQPPDSDWGRLTAGKMKNQIWQSSVNNTLQYDTDINPEGLAESLWWRFGDERHFKLFAHFAQLVLDEIGSDSNDPYLFDFQAGLEAKLNPFTLTVAGGYYLPHNLAVVGANSGSQPAGAAAPGAQSSSANRGNRTRQPGGPGTTLFYPDDFEVLYLRGEAVWKCSEDSFLGTPSMFTLSGEFLANLADANDNVTVAPGQTDGYAVQLALGRAKKQGEWYLAYEYKYLEADATWDAISDSDWGTGGTDRQGHVIKAAYQLRDWWQLAFTASITEKISHRPNSGNHTRGLSGEDLLRLQADTIFSF